MAEQTPKHYYLSDFPELYKTLKPGDVLEYPRGLYSHFGIYVGNYHNIEHCVVHMTTADDSMEARVFTFFREYIKKLEDGELDTQSQQKNDEDQQQSIETNDIVLVQENQPIVSPSGDLPPEGSGGVHIGSVESILSPDGYVLINNAQDQKWEVGNPEDVAKRAIERFENRDEEEPYSLPFNNCEHFATSTRYGVHKSQQIETAVAILVKTVREIKEEAAKDKKSD